MVSSLIEKLGRALDAEGIDYMIMGGQAVLVYGRSRLTADVDITLGLGPDQLPKVLRCIQQLKLKLRVENPEDFVRRTFVLPAQDPESNFGVDLVFSESEYEKEALRRIHKRKIGQTLVNFISPEDLIIQKIVAGRGHDYDDARSVLLKNPGLDREYIRRWLDRFDSSLAQDFSRTFAQLTGNETENRSP